MKILITGAAGFIGYHLVKRLLQENKINIVGIDNLNDYYDVGLKTSRLEDLGINILDYKTDSWRSDIYPNFIFRKVDISEAAELFPVFADEKFDIVIHLAAQAGVRYSLVNPHAYTRSNMEGFLNVVENVRRINISHFIYASSSSVYGNSNQVPFVESQEVNKPESLYAATKVSNEVMAYAYSNLYQMPSSGLRFFTVYGPYGRPDMAYYSFVQAIHQGRQIHVYNDGLLKRDFTYIDDITESIRRLIDVPPTGKIPHEIYNIGNNQPVQLMYFIQLIEKYMDKIADKKFLPMQKGDVFETYANIDKLITTINYKPQISIEVGLKRFVDWFINKHK